MNYSDGEEILTTIRNTNASFPQFLLNILELKSDEVKENCPGIQCSSCKRGMNLKEIEDNLIGIVGLFMPNSIYYTEILLGLMHAGLKIVILNPLLTKFQIRRTIETMQLSLIVTVSPFLKKLESVLNTKKWKAKKTQFVKRIIYFDDFASLAGTRSGILQQEQTKHQKGLLKAIEKGLQYSKNVLRNNFGFSHSSENNNIELEEKPLSANNSQKPFDKNYGSYVSVGLSASNPLKTAEMSRISTSDRIGSPAFERNSAESRLRMSGEAVSGENAFMKSVFVDEWKTPQVELVSGEDLFLKTPNEGGSSSNSPAEDSNEELIDVVVNADELALVYVNSVACSFFTHRNLIAGVLQSAHQDTLDGWACMRPKTVSLLGIPCFTLYALREICKSVILQERTVVLFEDFRLNHSNMEIIEQYINPAADVFKALEYWNVEILHTTPNHLRLMNVYNAQQEFLEVENFPFLNSSLQTIFTTGEKIDTDLIARIKHNFKKKFPMHKDNIHIRQVYGCSEAMGFIASQTEEQAMKKGRGYCGSIGLGIEMRIAQTRDIPKEFASYHHQFSRSKIGRIQIRGPNVASKVIYFNSKSQQMVSSAHLDDRPNVVYGDTGFGNGFLDTADEGIIDYKRNQLFVFGKLPGADNSIKVNGVFPVNNFEAQENLKRHPLVKDVVVVGVPDEIYGTKPKAFMILCDDEYEKNQYLAEQANMLEMGEQEPSVGKKQNTYGGIGMGRSTRPTGFRDTDEKMSGNYNTIIENKNRDSFAIKEEESYDFELDEFQEKDFEFGSNLEHDKKQQPSKLQSFMQKIPFLDLLKRNGEKPLIAQNFKEKLLEHARKDIFFNMDIEIIDKFPVVKKTKRINKSALIPKPPHKEGRFTGALLAGIIANIGIDIFILPWATGMAGLLPAFILLLIFGGFASFSQKIAADCAVEAGKDSYQDAVAFFLGPAYSYVVQIMQVFLTYGACVAFMVIMYSNLVDVIHLLVGPLCHTTLWFLCNRPIVLIIIALLLLPISYMRDINILEYVNFFCVGVIIYEMIFLVGEFIYNYNLGTTALNETVNDYSKNELNLLLNTGTNSVKFPNILLGWPIIVGAFANPGLPLPAVTAMPSPPKSTTTIIFLTSLCTVFLLYVPFCLAGYFYFGNDVQDDFLLNFPENNYFAIGGRVGAIFVCATNFFLLHFVGRTNVKSLIGLKDTPILHFVVTICGFIAIYFLSTIVDQLSIVLGFIDSVAASLLIYAIPALLLWKTKKDWPSKVISIAMIVIFVLLTVFGVMGNIMYLLKL